jgi:phosphoribosyl-ATP pyrophosphohydrolase
VSGAETRPVVVQAPTGEVVAVAATDEKGHRKSIEQGTLWVIDPETGRLLPHPEDLAVTSVTDQGDWLLARLAGAPEDASVSPVAPDAPTAGAPGEAAHASGGAGAALDAASGGALDVSVLSELWETIQGRNESRPEGSYTTHLFTQGEEKIRKKTGEEAVELLLARREEEIVHESADLIYHLLVLLESTGIGIAPLLAELRRRASS